MSARFLQRGPLKIHTPHMHAPSASSTFSLRPAIFFFLNRFNEISPLHVGAIRAYVAHPHTHRLGGPVSWSKQTPSSPLCARGPSAYTVHVHTSHPAESNRLGVRRQKHRHAYGQKDLNVTELLVKCSYGTYSSYSVTPPAMRLLLTGQTSLLESCREPLQDVYGPATKQARGSAPLLTFTCLCRYPIFVPSPRCWPSESALLSTGTVE